MVFRDKNFLVLGGGESGEAAIRLLVELSARVLVYDDGKGPEVERRLRQLSALGAADVSGTPFDRLLDDVYCVVLSPGVPADSPLPERAAARGIRVIGETELAAGVCAAPILAVTGTNGKSTTASLIHALLQSGGIHSRLLGNIGVPLSAEALRLTRDDFVCLEVSSFQLETAHAFCPHAATVLNVTPDHLNRHKTMEEYRRVKYRVFARQTASEYAVLNADLPDIAGLGLELSSDVYYYSAKHEVRGSFVEDGKLYFRDGPERQYLIDAQDIGIIGEHNLYNALCAVTFAKIVGVSNAAISRALHTFSGIKHRLQLVDTVEGKAYYNDSKGTNIGSTLCAARAMKLPTVLILGGSDKGYEFDELFSALPENIVHTVLMGETRYKLLEAAVRCRYANVSVCGDLDTAVRIASLRAPAGGAVLLSPACASFDAYRSFEERGDHFIELVKKLHEKAGF